MFLCFSLVALFVFIFHDKERCGALKWWRFLRPVALFAPSDFFFFKPLLSGSLFLVVYEPCVRKGIKPHNWLQVLWAGMGLFTFVIFFFSENELL